MKYLFHSVIALAFVFAAQMAIAQPYVTRHGLSPADYQTEFNKWTKLGYRLTCVSGYTQNGAEKYAAMWENTPGPLWVSYNGMNAQDYQTTFDNMRAKGYQLSYVSGYSVNNVPKFAGIWQQTNNPQGVARHNLTADQYQQAYDGYIKLGYRLIQVCGYAVGNTPYFAAIWDKSAGATVIAKHNLSAADFQNYFTSLGQQGYVLKMVSGYSPGGNDLYAAIWEKTSSPLQSARHGVDILNYQHVADNMYYQGYRPTYLNAFASGNSAKFNGTWTNTNMSWSDISKMDNAANGYMQSQGVKGLSLAVCKDGRLVFAKGYGMANSGIGEEMCPNETMRIMSVSKSMTSVGIMTLLQQGKISLNKHVFGPNSILGSKYPTPANKQALNNITVNQLLTHTSGLRTCNGESVFWDASKTPKDAMNVLLAANDLITTGAGQKYIYSNTNFFILARVIEAISGQTYEDFMRDNVLTPSGVGPTMYLGQANGQPKAGEASYQPADAMNLQLWSGFGGWVARPMDLLKVLIKSDGNKPPSDIIDSAAHVAMVKTTSLNTTYACGWIIDGSGNQSHNGIYNATRSWLVELGGGICYAVIINTAPNNDTYGATLRTSIEAGLSGVTYPAYNLF